MATSASKTQISRLIAAAIGTAAALHARTSDAFDFFEHRYLGELTCKALNKLHADTYALENTSDENVRCGYLDSRYVAVAGDHADSVHGMQEIANDKILKDAADRQIAKVWSWLSPYTWDQMLTEDIELLQTVMKQETLSAQLQKLREELPGELWVDPAPDAASGESIPPGAAHLLDSLTRRRPACFSPPREVTDGFSRVAGYATLASGNVNHFGDSAHAVFLKWLMEAKKPSGDVVNLVLLRDLPTRPMVELNQDEQRLIAVLAKRPGGTQFVQQLSHHESALDRLSFGAHFLNDSYAAGHIRVDRARLSPNRAMKEHDHDNQNGLAVRQSYFGKTDPNHQQARFDLYWRDFGDDCLLSPEARATRILAAFALMHAVRNVAENAETWWTRPVPLAKLNGTLPDDDGTEHFNLVLGLGGRVPNRSDDIAASRIVETRIEIEYVPPLWTTFFLSSGIGFAAARQVQVKPLGLGWNWHHIVLGLRPIVMRWSTWREYFEIGPELDAGASVDVFSPVELRLVGDWTPYFHQENSSTDTDHTFEVFLELVYNR
jgi:hypothetical protein